MDNMTGKKLAIIICVAVGLALIAFAAFFVPAVNKFFVGILGPIGPTLANIGKIIPTWSLTSGTTLFIFYILVFLLLPASVAYITWVTEWPYRITGAPEGSNTAGNFQSAPTSTIPVTGLQSQPTEDSK
jgi:hypothetical protein